MDTLILNRTFADTCGVFTPAMASQLNLSRRDVARLRANEEVVRVCGMGMTAAGNEITPARRAMAARLTWPEGIICFRSAGEFHGFKLDDDGLTHMLMPNGRRPNRGLVPHSWSVRPTEVERRGPLLLTDRRTTFADCLGRLPEPEAWGLLAWHWTRDELTEEDIAAQLDERNYLHGVVRLRAMLDAVRDGALSMGEVKFHGFLRDDNITGWEADQKIWCRGRIVARVDVLFRSLRLILEFDGAIAHNESTAVADAARDELLTSLGYRVEHVTWAQMYERPGELRRRIRTAIQEAAARIAA